MAARFTTAKHPDDHRTVYEEVPAQESSDSSQQTRAASIKMFGKLTHDSFEWHPNRILCKRFNIPNPYPGSDVVGVPKIRRPKFTLGESITPQTEASQALRAITCDEAPTGSEGDQRPDRSGKTSKSVAVAKDSIPNRSESMSVDSTTKFSVEPSSMPTASSSSAGTGSADLPSGKSEQTTTIKGVQNEAYSAPKRPSMDLFIAIFANSSTDESEGSDGEEDGDPRSLPIQVSENVTAKEMANSHSNAKTNVSNTTDHVRSDHNTLEEGLSSITHNKEQQRAIETERVMLTSTETEKPQSSPDTFGPAPPPSLLTTKTSRSFSGEKRAEDRTQKEEELNRKRRIKKDKRKETKKRYSESSDSEEEYRSKHRHKHKEKKKHKHKSKSKHRDEEREKFSDKKETGTNTSNQSTQQIPLSDDKQILSKLKNLQNLKAGRRMRAADFM